MAFNASCCNLAYIDGFMNILFAASVDLDNGSGSGYLLEPPDPIELTFAYIAIISCWALSNTAADWA